MKYGWSRTRSHSALVSAPGLSQIPFSTATRPRSCTRPARRRTPQRGVVEPGVAARVLGERGNPAGMAADPWRLEVGEVRERGENVVEPVRLDGRRAPGLSGESSLPLVAAGERREDVRSGALERLDDRRIVRPAASLPRPGAGVLALRGREVRVSRDHRDAYRQWDGLTREPGREPLPVPALVRVGERLEDGLRQADAASQHDADLAMGRQRALRALRVCEPAGNEPEAPPAGLAGRDAAHERPQHLPGRAHEHRSHRGVERQVVAPDQGGRLGGIGRAAEEPEQRELVHRPDLLRRAAQRLRQRDRDGAGAESVAERLTRPEVRRERHRGEELRQPKRAGRPGSSDPGMPER